MIIGIIAGHELWRNRLPAPVMSGCRPVRDVTRVAGDQSSATEQQLKPRSCTPLHPRYKLILVLYGDISALDRGRRRLIGQGFRRTRNLVGHARRQRQLRRSGRTRHFPGAKTCYLPYILFSLLLDFNRNLFVGFR